MKRIALASIILTTAVLATSCASVSSDGRTFAAANGDYGLVVTMDENRAPQEIFIEGPIDSSIAENWEAHTGRTEDHRGYVRFVRAER